MMSEAAPAQADAVRLRSGIRALVRRFSVTERADVACCGITVAQAATIETLAATGPLRLGDLGRRLGITPSTLTRNLTRLLEAGLVEREADAEDARASRVALTDAGRRAAVQRAEQEADFGREILERLPSDRRPVVVLALQDLLVAVREATERCCPGAFDHLMTDYPERGGCCDERCE
jgi:DNA-binding MarR family transcriptional regulator